MLHRSVIDTQLEFYKKGGAGCLFAAHAAGDPEKYQWRLSVSGVDEMQIESLVQEAVDLSDVSTQNIIFPSVLQVDEFAHLLSVIQKVPSFFLEQEQVHENMICLGFRVKVGDKVSWLTGLAGFAFLPKTRQAVFTEIVF